MASEQASTDSVEAIKQAIPGDVLSSAQEAGVDVDTIVQDNLTKHGDYSVKTIARFVKTDIQNQVEAEKADELSGIIMGSRDRFGANWPRRWSLVKSDGEHIQVSTWEGELDGPGGGKIDIPVGGAVVKMRCAFDEEYESWEGKRIEAVRELDPSEVVENLSEVAINPTDLSRGDEESTVVLKGTVAFVNPQTVFAGDDQEDWYDGEVLMESERGELLPHLEISFDTGGDEYRVRGHFDRQAYGRPYLQVPDLEKLCHDAVRHRDDPDSQAQFVQNGLRGEEVIAVGRVNSFTTDRDDGDVVHYVDIGMSALVATDGTAQATIEESADVDEPESEADAEPEPEPAPAPAAESDVVAGVRSQIEQYCEVTGTDIGDLTVDDVHDKMKGIEAPDVAIRQALGGGETGTGEESEETPGIDPGDHTVPELKEALDDVDSGDELARMLDAEREGKSRKTAEEAILSRREELGDDAESDEDEGFEPDTDADDPFEAVEEDGLFHCPADDDGESCLFQAGSTGELAAHAIDEHDAVGDPGEWVRAQIEG